ncbi:MAG: DUF2800 domain-containing protein [Eubacterium sp.]
MAEHAKLSASGSARWLSCPPSVRLESDFPESTSLYAKEGTLAHGLGELQLRNENKEITERQFKMRLKKLNTENPIDNDMIEFVSSYTEFVMETLHKEQRSCSDASLMVEQRLDFSRWVPEGFGTGDAVIISDGTLEIIDLKYGKGVAVSAENNPQMRLYALGATETFGCLYDFEQVTTTIYQPRLGNVSSETLAVETLLEWAETEVKPKAQLAFKGEGTFLSGEHCRFCKAKGVCRTRADANIALAQEEFKSPELLEPEEIAVYLKKAKDLSTWVESLKDFAQERAVNHGAHFPGMKLVEGRSNRIYTSDKQAVEDTLVRHGYTEKEIYEPQKLLGITAMEKLLGKKKFTEVLAKYVIKPKGKPTLVFEDDKRPALNTHAEASEDFKDKIN